MPEVATKMPEVLEMSLDELVRRVRAAASKRGKRNPDRLLLFNTALALEELGRQLEGAWKVTKLAEKPILCLPGGLHRVN